jgi:ATP-dependent DNA helicase RecG
VGENRTLVETLRKILEHERRLGFTDRAVQGGLERFIERWQLRFPEVDRPLAAALTASLTGYAQLSPPERERAVADSLGRVERGDPALLDASPLPGLSPPPAPAGAATKPTPDPIPASAGIRQPGTSVTSDNLANNRLVSPPGAENADGAGSPTAPSEPADPTRVRRRRPTTSPMREAATSTGPALDEPLTSLRGIGPANAERFTKLGIVTIRDLLYHFPRRHLDYRAARLIRDLTFEGFETILATIWNTKVERRPGGLLIIRAVLADETGTADAIWFRRKDYLSQDLSAGRTVVLSGECRIVGGRPVFRDPEWEVLTRDDTIHTARLVPVYPLVEGLNTRLVRRVAKQAVDRYADQVVDFLPATVREEHRLLDLASAIVQAHYPDSDELLSAARRRLAFDELLVVQLGLLARRRSTELGDPAPVLGGGDEAVAGFLGSLPYELTGAQARALATLRSGLGSSRPLSLLLEGDVGSGKTIVAATGAVQVAANGFQTALMAPTEILAEQHHRTLSRLFSAPGAPSLQVALVTGAVKGAERRERYAAIATGQVNVVVGTQALVQETLEFARLGFVIIDEQHRFGVEQRSSLRQKGYNPHVLVMTATPIPRTLALTLYGDLDLAIIDELPPGRQIIRTRQLQPADRPRAYEFLRKEVRSGHQAFIICPLVEESDHSEARAATTEYERLQRDVFPELQLGLLHGRLKAADKDAAMRKFQRGELDVLVSTAVVEVGIDVPNATVMLIEGADRFGLAQLHQFRGRVGRGSAQSYCLLLSDSSSDIGRRRLAALETTHDGFALAMEDLKMRGPGEFFGTRQSGLPDLKMAQLTDVRVVEEARAAALQVYAIDASLSAPEHRGLRVMVERFWQGKLDLN